jgi:hypothetical protein
MNNDREEILEVTKASFKVFDVPTRYRLMILKAFSSYNWNFEEKSDGLTFFNTKWSNEFHPVFVWHDFAMQNRETLRGSESVTTYVRNTNLTLKKLLEIYNFSILKQWAYPILATLAYKLFER